MQLFVENLSGNNRSAYSGTFGASVIRQQTASMKDKFLKSLIDKLNVNNTQGLFHLRPLTDRVEFTKVWVEKPKPKDGDQI